MPVEQQNAPGSEQLLDEVVAAYMEAKEAGEAPDRGEWLARHPVIAAELAAFFGDEDQFDSLVAPLRTGTPRPGEGSGLPPTTPQGPRTPPVAGTIVWPGTDGLTLGDYEILEEIARGGMGIVYKARQVSLNRLVALKMIRGGQLAHGAEVQRFRREAEAAAHLDHPHIVPIYDVSEHDGAPYFTMKLIDGGNLAQRLVDFRLPKANGQNKKTLRAENANRKANILVLLATVARAVDYAHQRGLLHRDLKPANILLDAQGRPHVTDFGLVKRVSTDEAGQTAAVPRGSLTESGIAVGTPNYMAPEQAAGPKKALTTAADVYSLGAILYELLTGRPPFDADTPLETLVAVLEREPVRPRALSPFVDADLETVCLKCLEKDPSRRYPSARELAEDLERILAGEPIQARPSGGLARLGRWCRRNVALALACGVAAVALLAVAGGSFVFALREASHAGEANEAKTRVQDALGEAKRRLVEANEQRTLAEQRFRQAHRAVGEFCIQLGERQLARYPGLQPVRQAILRAGVKYYKEFLKQKQNDPRLRKEMADTLFSLAFISNVLGKEGDAQAAYEQALTYYQDVLRADPTNAGAQEGLARTSVNLGILHKVFGRPEAALASYRRARDYYSRLNKAHPDQLAYRSGLVASYVNLAGLYRTSGRPVPARAAIRKGLVLAEELVRREPRSARYQRDLSVCLVSLGALYDATDRGQDALACWARARAIQEKQVKAHPNDLEMVRDLAANYHCIGYQLCTAGKTKEGLPSLEKGRRLLERLVRTNRRVTEYVRLLAGIDMDAGQFQESRGQIDKALERYRQAGELREQLARRYPHDQGYQAALAATYTALGGLEEKRGRKAQAMEFFQKAVPLAAEAAGAVPDNGRYRADFSLTLYRFGTALERIGRLDAAAAALWQSVEQRRAALERTPRMVDHVRKLSLYSRALAAVEIKRGHTSACVRTLLECLVLLDEFARLDPRHMLLQCDLSDTLVALGSVFRRTRHWQDARNYYQRARAIRARLLRIIPTEPHFQGAQGDIYYNLATIYFALRQRHEELQYYQKSRDTLLKVAQTRPDLLTYRKNLCVVLHNLGLTFRHFGDTAAAAVSLRQAVEQQRKIIADFPNQEAARQSLARHYRSLAASLRAGHHAAEAAEAVAEWRKLAAPEPRELYLMARELSLIARDVSAGKTPSTGAPSSETKNYGNQAVELLREAVRRGFRDGRRLENSPDFSALRSRQDFQALLAELRK
jgi:serine/threonine-protein kinase